MIANPAQLMLRALSLAICLLLSDAHARAEDVSIELKGIDLLANLELAQGKSLKKNGVMLIVHDTLSHNHSEFISPLQQNLQMGGINTLAITLSLGLDRRNGPYPCSLAQDVRNSDAVEEIEAWVGWLRSQNVRAITLTGHGWGGDQIARYALAKNNPDNAPDAAPKKSKKKGKEEAEKFSPETGTHRTGNAFPGTQSRELSKLLSSTAAANPAQSPVMDRQFLSQRRIKINHPPTEGVADCLAIKWHRLRPGHVRRYNQSRH